MYRLFMVLLIAFAAFFLSALLAVLLTEALFGISFTAISSNPDFERPEVLNALRFVQVLNSSALFLVPALAYSLLMRSSLTNLYGFGVRPRPLIFVLIFLLVIFALPLENFIGHLNHAIHFPEAFDAFEAKLRAMEAQAERTTMAFLRMDSFGAYLLSLVIMAVLPALGEELLFRGVLQKLLGEQFKNPHLAIWLSAIVFSAIHMQFFGFFPRMVMGAALGYLFYWSGSLWYPILAHFLNNAIAVSVVYFIGLDKLPKGIEDTGAESPYLFLLSAVVCASLLIQIRRSLSSNSLGS